MIRSLMTEAEAAAVKRAASDRGVSVSDWARDALVAAVRRADRARVC